MEKSSLSVSVSKSTISAITELANLTEEYLFLGESIHERILCGESVQIDIQNERLIEQNTNNICAHFTQRVCLMYWCHGQAKFDGGCHILFGTEYRVIVDIGFWDIHPG